MSYDVKCDALARAFLADAKRETDEALVAELAQVIQTAIEDFVDELEVPV